MGCLRSADVLDGKHKGSENVGDENEDKKTILK
jgi:hypothetical protein